MHTYNLVLGRQGRSSRPFSATEGVEASLDYVRPCLKIQRKPHRTNQERKAKVLLGFVENFFPFSEKWDVAIYSRIIKGVFCKETKDTTD